MTIGSFDFETCLIKPAWQNPPPVCLSWAVLEPAELRIEPGFANGDPQPHFRELISRREVAWFGNNISFDCAVAMAWGLASPAEIFDAVEQGRILDLAVYEKIAQIGNFTQSRAQSLAMLHQAHGLGELSKGEVRTSYEPLFNRPISEYSAEQIQYALSDVYAGVKVAQRQLKRYQSKVNLSDVSFLTAKQLWLHLTRSWGMRTAPDSVDVLEREATLAVAELQELAQKAGIVRANGSRDMKAIRAIVSEAYDSTPPMTKAKKDRKSKKPFVPQVKTDKETLIASGNPVLETLADFGSWKSILGSDLNFLKAGAVEPIHTKFWIADTTRSTSSSPNLQNLRRAARKDCNICHKSAPAFTKRCQCGSTSFTMRQGIRECFVPRPGFCFVAIDHSGLELATLAQNCVTLLGRYDLANKLNDGVDPHAEIACEIHQISYQEGLVRKASGDKEFSNSRNCGKVVNFGRPGGLAAATLVLYAKTAYGIDMTLEFATELIQFWERVNPDGAAFLQYIRRLRRGDRFDLVIPGTTIQRNQTTYCSAANCHFQGLGAALEAAVGWEIAREMYTGTDRQGRPSILRFCRIVLFVHDEFILEVPIGIQTEVAERLNWLMTEHPVLLRYLPDVKIRAEYGAMIRWSKAAKDKRGPDGRLLIHGLEY